VSPGAIVGVELRRIMLDLVTPFRTSFGEQTSRDVLLVAVTVDHDGAVTKGWGECVALSDPHYSPEFVDGAQLVLAEHLVPLARAAPLTAETFRDRVASVKGHQMAKAALEMALLDAELRHAERSFGEWLGVARTTVPSGVSVGIFDETERLLAEVADYVAAGYARIKLKIQPGWDLEQVAAVRSLVGADAALQVDANTAYTRDDIGHLCALDEFDLLLIEQPLAEDDLLGHVQLAQASRTPVCSTSRSTRCGSRSMPSSWAPAASSTSSRVASAATWRRGASTTPAPHARWPCGAVEWWRRESVVPPTSRSPRSLVSLCRATSAAPIGSGSATSSSIRS